MKYWKVIYDEAFYDNLKFIGVSEDFIIYINSLIDVPKNKGYININYNNGYWEWGIKPFDIDTYQGTLSIYSIRKEKLDKLNIL